MGSDATEKVMPTEPIAGKFSAFGWKTLDVDGHDLTALHGALAAARELDRHAPQCVVAHTVKGKGVSFIEGARGHHGRALTADEAKRALAELA